MPSKVKLHLFSKMQSKAQNGDQNQINQINPLFLTAESSPFLKGFKKINIILYNTASVLFTRFILIVSLLCSLDLQLSFSIEFRDIIDSPILIPAPKSGYTLY